MKPPPPLTVELRPSHRATALIVTAYAATAGLLLALPLPAGACIAGAATIAVACAWALWQVAGPPATALLRVGIDRRIVVHARSGESRGGEIAADSCVGCSLTTIVWRPDGAACARTLMILPGMLAAEDFRRLRVMLRYGRAMGAEPASNDVDAG
jgi:hypothetical protein